MLGTLSVVPTAAATTLAAPPAPAPPACTPAAPAAPPVGVVAVRGAVVAGLRVGIHGDLTVIATVLAAVGPVASLTTSGVCARVGGAPCVLATASGGGGGPARERSLGPGFLGRGFISARVAISSERFFRRAAWSISTRTRLVAGE